VKIFYINQKFYYIFYLKNLKWRMKVMTRETKGLCDEEIRKALKKRGVPDDEIPKLSRKMERFIEKELINRSSDSDFRSKFNKNPRNSLRKTKSKPIRDNIDRLLPHFPSCAHPRRPIK